MSRDLEALLRRLKPEKRLRPLVCRPAADLIAAGRAATRRLINDILIPLTARQAGAAVLTANLADFDHARHLVPDAGVIFYEAVSEANRQSN